MPYPSKTSPGAILSAALSLLETQGPQGLTMRSLAAALGLRASSLYRYYPDREALEAALADEGSRLLGAALREASEGQPAAEALRRASHAYLTFARARPDLYSLMHAPRPPALAGPGPAKDVRNLVLDLVGGLSGRPDDTAAAVAFWAFLHGFAQLERGGQFGLSGPQKGFERGLEALIQGL